MNLPNKLSVFRFILSPIMILIMYFVPKINIDMFNLNHLIITIIFVIGSITDYLDGKIAREKSLTTDFGKFIDPLADKVLVLTAMILMVEMGKIPSWIPIIVIIREFAVSGYRLVKASKSGKVVAASIWGKIKTLTQMIGIIFILLSPNNFMDFLNLGFGINLIYLLNCFGSIFIIISVIATIFSGYDYLKDGKDILKDA